jgi:nucleoid DNA-binding protein
MAILKKADFVKKVSEEAGVSQEQVKNVLEAIDTISLNSLKNFPCWIKQFSLVGVPLAR